MQNTTEEVAPAKNKSKSRLKVSKVQPDLEKRGRALELRLRGYSYKAVGADLKISEQRAYSLVKEGLETARTEYMETASEVLQFELARIERMITTFEAIAFPEDVVPTLEYKEVKDPETGEVTSEVVAPKISSKQLEAVMMVDKLLDRKARLLGFYKSDDSAVKTPLPWSDDDK